MFKTVLSHQVTFLSYPIPGFHPWMLTSGSGAFRAWRSNKGPAASRYSGRIWGLQVCKFRQARKHLDFSRIVLNLFRVDILLSETWFKSHSNLQPISYMYMPTYKRYIRTLDILYVSRNKYVDPIPAEKLLLAILSSRLTLGTQPARPLFDRDLRPDLDWLTSKCNLSQSFYGLQATAGICT